MQPSNQASRHALIVADRSADIKIAGLRQIDRTLLALNEYAAARNERLTVLIRSSAPTSFTCGTRLSHIDVEEETDPHDVKTSDFVLTTRTVLPRFQFNLPDTIVPEKYPFIRDRRDIARAERELLRRTTKSQDGIVARNFDRRISQAITRILLRTPITPTFWTIAILPFAIAAFAAFIWGGWTATFIGMVLIEIQSILDGCDGELARAKYLESESGRRLDTVCDIAIEILIAVGIGIGLWRTTQMGMGALYFSEGIVTGGLIATREWLLAGNAQGTDEAGSTLYRRHEHLVRRSGIFGLGKQFSTFLIQLTKRDVGITFFLFLAAIGQGEWILHLLCLVAIGSLAAMPKPLPND